MTQYQRPGSNQVAIAVNDVVLITTPEGTSHPSGCGCGVCAGGGAVTGAQGTHGTQGVQGATGTQGVQGIAGAVGSVQGIVGLVSYEFTQGTASSSWIINHNLGFKPNVTVVDSAGTIYEGEITYTNTNSLTVTFSAAFSGKAYLS